MILVGSFGLMDQKTKTKNPTRKKGPYDEYINSPLWSVIEKELKALEKNTDIVITTDSYYVVGYLVKALSSNGPKNEKS